MDELIQEWGLDTGLHSKEAIIDALTVKLADWTFLFPDHIQLLRSG